MLKERNGLLKRIVIYAFMFITLLQCNSVYIYSESSLRISKNLINVIWQILLIVVLTLFLNMNNNIKYLNNLKLQRFILIFSFISIFFIIYESIYYPSFNKFFSFKLFIDTIALISLFYFLDDNKLISTFFIKFENLVILSAMISLLFWIAFAFKFPMTTSIYLNWGKHIVSGYYGIDFFAQPNVSFSIFGLSLPRNSGIFTEASMFSYVLLISLLIELFIRHNKKPFNIRIFILLITIISTNSTTGILVAFVALVYYWLTFTNSISLGKICIIFIIPIIFVLLRYVLMSKIGSSGTNIGSSYSVRFDDIRAGIKTWLIHPLLGSGLGSDNLIYNNMSSWRYLLVKVPQESAGFTSVLADGGILLGSFYVIPTVIALKYSNKLFGLAIFSFVPFIFVVSQGYYIYLMILSYFWAIILSYNKNNYIN